MEMANHHLGWLLRDLNLVAAIPACREAVKKPVKPTNKTVCLDVSVILGH